MGEGKGMTGVILGISGMDYREWLWKAVPARIVPVRRDLFFFLSPARTQRARAPAHASTQHYGNTQTSTESQTYNRTLSHQVLLANHHREWA